MKLTYEVDRFGTKRYTNAKGKLHRTDGPACEWTDGSKTWYVNDKRHRTDGPAAEWTDGTKAWYVNDKLHRTDGPAIEYATGYKDWYLNGEQLTEAQFDERTKPVVKAVKVKSTYSVDRFGTKLYTNAKGQLHRLDGPALESASGSKYWHVDGHLHRTDGPAAEWADGTKTWYEKGLRHRTDGPAVEYADGTKIWYLNGKRLTEAQFNERTKPVVKAVKAKLQTIDIDGVTYKLVRA